MSTGPFEIARGVQYMHNPVHRNNAVGKSQWQISMPDERAVFEYAYQAEWIDQTQGWGLRLVNGSPDYLGVARDHVTRVFVAKFVDSVHSSIWHGFPVDFVDRPPEAILEKWGSVLKTRVRRKLSMGQPCSL